MSNKNKEDFIAPRFYLKNKGGDPRNHEWHEVSETMFIIATEDEFFKKADPEWAGTGGKHSKPRS